MLRFAG